MGILHPLFKRGVRGVGQPLDHHPWWRTLCENGRCGVLMCRISHLRRADHHGLHRLCFRRGRHFSKFSSRQVLEQFPLKQFPLSWSPLLLAQLLIVLKKFLNLHPFSFVSPRYHTNFPVSISFKIWVPPHSALGSSLSLSPVTLKVVSSRSLNSSQSRVFTSCRLSFWYLVPSSETKL